MNPDSAKNYYSFYVQDVYVGFVNILEEKKEEINNEINQSNTNPLAAIMDMGSRCCRPRMKILKNYTLQNPCT